MGKVKGEAREQGGVGGDRRPVVVTIKGTPEWGGWVRGFAAFKRTDASKLIDLALVKLAEAEGYEPKAPPR